MNSDLRISQTGHNRSHRQPKDRVTTDRFTKYSRHKPTATRKCVFSKAVAQRLVALISIRCTRYVSSPHSRTGAAGQLPSVATGIRRTSLVFKGGVAFAPAEIHEALGIRPFVEAPAIVKAAAN